MKVYDTNEVKLFNHTQQCVKQIELFTNSSHMKLQFTDNINIQSDCGGTTILIYFYTTIIIKFTNCNYNNYVSGGINLHKFEFNNTSNELLTITCSK